MIAELPDGTELEFPDDTPDDVVDRVVKQHLGQSKPQASWGDVLQGGLADAGNIIGTGLTQAMAGIGTVLGAEVDNPDASPEKKARTAAAKEATAKMLQPFFETKEGIRSTMEGLDPTIGKELSTGQRVGKAAVQLGAGLATGPMGLAGMMAGGTTREVDKMMSEGMPVDKAQQYGFADAALNTGAVALGGVGPTRTTQALSLGAGNVAADEAAHLLANKFREDEGLKLNERDMVDRAISFGMGVVPGALASPRKTAEDLSNTPSDPNAKAKVDIDAELARQEQESPLNKPSTLELLDKEAYPEPLGNRTIDPDTGTVTTGMAEDVPTIDFPLRPEAMEADAQFQELQKSLLAERKLLEEKQEAGASKRAISKQEAAVEAARAKFGEYLDQGYGIKEGADAYRGLYESGKEPSLKIERGFDPRKWEDGKKELGLEPMAKEGKSDPLAFAKGLEERVVADDYTGALEYIAKNKANDIEGKVADLLLRVGDTTVRTGAGKNLALESPDGKLSSVGGLYIPAEHKIMMDALSAGDVRSFLHEAVHTATGNALKFFDLGMEGKLSMSERIQARRVKDLFNTVTKMADAKALKQYGMKDSSEFIAEAFSNPAFQTYLKSVELPRNSLKTAWNSFVDSVRGMLGLDAKYNTALAEIMSSGSRLIESSTKATRESQLGKKHIDKVLSQPMGVQKGKLDRFASFDDFKKSLPENLRAAAADYWVENGRQLPKTETSVLNNEAVNKTLGELTKSQDIQYFTQNHKSAEEIVGIVKGHKNPDGTPKDISDKSLRNHLASSNWAMSALVKHPLVHWVVSKYTKAVKEAEVVSETLIAEQGKGFMAILSAGSKEKISDLSARMRAMEGKEGTVPTLSGWEKRFMESFSKARETTLARVNEVRKTKDLPPIEPRLNYLASMFTGEFRVLVKEGDKTVGWVNGRSKSELEQAKSYLEGNGYTFSNAERIPYARSKDFQKMMGRRMAAFDEVIRVFGENDPSVAQFSERLENMYSKQAYDHLDFKQHFKKKSGVFGAEGFKGWVDPYQNARDLWQAQAEYIRAANMWVAQQKVDAEVAPVLVDPQIKQDHPNAHALADMMYKNAFGKLENELPILEKAADLYVNSVNSDIFTGPVMGRVGKGLQKVNPNESLRALKNWTVHAALSLNAGFMATQFVQVPIATATMINFFKDQGLNKASGKQALGLAILDSSVYSMYNSEAGRKSFEAMGFKEPPISDVGKYFNDYVTDNHITTPHILEKTDMYSGNPVLKSIQWTDKKLGDTISKPEEITRRTAFNTLAHYLYASGLSKENAAEMAEVATSIAMVDYSRSGRPMVFNKAGILGDMAATVNTYKHNAFTQMAIYGTDNPRALATMLLSQFFMGGLVGFYAVDEVDELWQMIRDNLPGMDKDFRDLPSLKETMIRNTPEWVAFGGASALTRGFVPEGVDISAKYSMDNAFGDSLAEVMFPLFSILGRTAEAAGKAAGAPTFENISGVAYPMVPSAGRGLMENFLYTEDGAYVPPRTDKKDVNRTFNEQALRVAGMKSLDERKKTEIEFRFRDTEMREKEQQKSSLEKMRSYARAKDQEKVMEQAVKYVVNGGEPRQVMAFLTQAQKDMVLDKVQRLNQKSLSTRRQQEMQMRLEAFKREMKAQE